MSCTQSNFFGRKNELNVLRNLWNEATFKGSSEVFGGPRMAIILAETGYGKTRLIQAFYQELSRDPLWDPPELNYWPDAFQNVNEQLRVNPEMENHKPGGPPRFLWSGMRWSPPNERNIEERTCSLPEIRHVLSTHKKIAQDYAGIWVKMKSATVNTLRSEGLSETAEQLVDWAGIPFAGLIIKGAKSLGGLFSTKNPSTFHGESEKKAVDITEELMGDFRDLFGSIRSGGLVLPTILFLDDAQWIDSITLHFLDQLWKEADSKKWPLLVLVTHWERNWRELLKKPETIRKCTLANYAKKKNVHIMELGPSSVVDLGDYVNQRLPGLTDIQKKLLLEKAGGNFLTLVENVGFLLQNKINFENGNVLGRLSKGGESKVRTWEENRQKRIEQMFAELSEETKTILGWSGQLGIRFIEEVVVDFAKRQGVDIEPETLLAECVDPLVILGKSSQNIREFRHKAFYYVASQYFREYLFETELLLKQVLQEHLHRWVNHCFSENGELIEIDNSSDSIQAAIFLERLEQRDLLNMAVQEFRPEEGKKEISTTWIRAVILSVLNDSAENLWDLVREKGDLLIDIDWEKFSQETLSLDTLETLSMELKTSGVIQSCLYIRRFLASQRKLIYQKTNTIESLESYSWALLLAGDIEEDDGNLVAAKHSYDESLHLSRSLAKRLDKPQALVVVCGSLCRMGGIEMKEGNLANAKSLFLESLQISRNLAPQLGTPQALRDVTLSLLRVGDIEHAEGNLAGAKRLFLESLEISRNLTEQLEATEVLRLVACTLYRVGDIEKAEGNLAGAKRFFLESLQISRNLTEQLETPEALQEVSFTLHRVGDIEHVEGNLAGAKRLFLESLEISRNLTEQLETNPLLLRGVILSLHRVGDIEKAEGNLATAKILFIESLQISRNLAPQLGTPQALRDVTLSLLRVGGIEKAEGNLAVAKRLFLESLQISKNLAEQLETPILLWDICHTLNNTGAIEKTLGNIHQAESLFAEYFQTANKMMDIIPSSDHLNEKIWSLQQWLHTKCILGKNSEALELCHEQEANAYKLESEFGGNYNFLDTVAAYWERRSEVEKILGINGHEVSMAKALRLRNFIKENSKERP